MRSIPACAVSKTKTNRVCLAFLTILALSFPAAFAQNACTAFGNPPRGNILAVVPVCGEGGALLNGFTDSGGTPRFACLYPPSAPAAGVKYPMIVFLHPSLVNADSVKNTPLFADRDTVNISDGAVTGFIILAPQGRNTEHFYPPPDNQASGWDNWYRQMSPTAVNANGQVFTENVDAATIDHFIQQQIATGTVDTNRIYLVGWSNGAAMSFLYGANRGNIAAAAVYSAPDPFGALEDPCQQTPVSGPPAGQQQIQLSAAGIPTLQVPQRLRHRRHLPQLASDCRTIEGSRRDHRSGNDYRWRQGSLGVRRRLRNQSQRRSQQSPGGHDWNHQPRNLAGKSDPADAAISPAASTKRAAETVKPEAISSQHSAVSRIDQRLSV